MALAAGATLVVMDDEATHLGPDLVSWLRTEGITILHPPPTLLRSMGCYYGQGYLFSRPVDGAAAGRLLAAQEPAAALA